MLHLRLAVNMQNLPLQHLHPSTDNLHFVRPATPNDATAIGELTAQSMHETIVAAIEAPLTSTARSIFDSKNFADIWRNTLAQLPSSDHHALVAIADEKICGFIALSPTQPLTFPANHPATTQLPATREAFEITNFDINAKYYGENHEARMLAAVTDILQGENIEIYIWVFSSAHNLIRFLDKAGFAPLGYQREFTIDSHKCTQHLWWTTLKSKE